MRKIYCDRCKRLIPFPEESNPIITVKFENILYEIRAKGLEDDYCKECIEFAVANFGQGKRL